MKTPIAICATMALLLTAPVRGWAEELTTESILGKWLFTHILMDKTQEIQVNKLTEFLPNGSAIFYLAPGVERDRGSYEITADAIVYTDKNGKQVWKLVSFTDDELHVDHKGAEMFFVRQ